MGVNIKTLKDRIRAQVVWKDVVRRKFRHDVSIGDAEVDKALTDAGESAKPQEETTLELRQIKYEIPTEAPTRQPSPGSSPRSRRCAQSSSLAPMSRR